ncbi:glutathione S-transferase Mu 2-like [Paramacrobiotus metropolitanus]|uniref:glutathione S-transferase Mu 2-like n=1 Tax=Paramacrobiotus metropolitanus TaxID=2943436 RepID=UPI002445D829|nr:glutathione S-transferase Mu 2-like [Paramacrobiotus metropolitanus]
MAPVLGYWNIRGLVTPIRYLLEHVGQEYEWKGYDFENADEWKNNKEKLGMEFPNLPYYIDGDQKLTQSHAILRYLARKHGLIAKNDKDALEQDIIDGVIFDLIIRWGWLCYGANDLEKDKAAYRSEQLTPILKQLEHHLSKREYCVGNYLTYTDFVLYERLDGNQIMFPDILDNFPNLKKFHERIGNLKGIKEFRTSNRFKKVLNGAIAKWNNN